MAETFNYRAYSMEYGTFVGIAWSLLFLSYFYGVRDNNALLLLASFALCAVGFFLPFILGLRLNAIMSFNNMRLSYLKALMFSFSMFMYACLLSGLISYFYFEFLDDGELLSAISTMLNNKEIISMYNEMKLAEQYGELLNMIKELENLSSFESALLIFNNNFTWSMIMSFLVPFAVIYRLPQKNKSN
ncbi:MAG: DUF4199 domain-containing protein [Prevotellaceae bacterium]|nr:DUF4199 domain-containing protein [Candidatus Minthosoma caballi]